MTPNHEAELTQAEANENKDPSIEPQDTTHKKKRRRDTSIDSVLKVLQDAKNERAERFERKMSLLERLVQAVEGKPAQAE